jgi:NADPH2:quinone reductase
MYAIRIRQHGGPEVLVREEINLGNPGPGQVLVKNTAIGLNFIDTYHRSGLYPLPLPSGIGMESVGVVEAVGPGVTSLKPGDRVGYGWPPVGAYASHMLIDADRLIMLPDDIEDEVAAAILLKGCTTEYLLRRTYAVRVGDNVLVHAAAGGVGLLMVQWLKALGALVIGTVGSAEKAKRVAEYGCDHVILYRTQDIAQTVRDITKGAGVDVVYDGVGKDSFVASLDSLKPRGLLVSYGNASGPVKDVDIGILAAKGSLYVTRPTIAHYYATAEDRAGGTSALFEQVRAGHIKVCIDQRYALTDAAQAHRDLESRQTTGSSILMA